MKLCFQKQDQQEEKQFTNTVLTFIIFTALNNKKLKRTLMTTSQVHSTTKVLEICYNEHCPTICAYTMHVLISSRGKPSHSHIFVQASKNCYIYIKEENPLIDCIHVCIHLSQHKKLLNLHEREKPSHRYYPRLYSFFQA